MATVLPLRIQRRDLRQELKQAKIAHREMLVKLEVAKLRRELARYQAMINAGQEELDDAQRNPGLY